MLWPHCWQLLLAMSLRKQHPWQHQVGNLFRATSDTTTGKSVFQMQMPVPC